LIKAADLSPFDMGRNRAPPRTGRRLTLAPTAIAVLKGLGAEFGAWPEVTIERGALVYGGRALPGVANGALFVLGTIAGVQGVVILYQRFPFRPSELLSRDA
jgi:hypothetical protein